MVFHHVMHVLTLQHQGCLARLGARLLHFCFKAVRHTWYPNLHYLGDYGIVLFQQQKMQTLVAPEP